MPLSDLFKPPVVSGDYGSFSIDPIYLTTGGYKFDEVNRLVSALSVENPSFVFAHKPSENGGVTITWVRREHNGNSTQQERDAQAWDDPSGQHKSW